MWPDKKIDGEFSILIYRDGLCIMRLGKCLFSDAEQHNGTFEKLTAIGPE